MKDSRENFITRFLCVQTNTKIFNKENKLYSFLLHEDFYPILFQNIDNSFEKFSFGVRKSNIKNYQRESFLTIKYCIFLFRSNKFSSIKRSFFSHRKSYDPKKDENYFELKKNILFYLIFESITFILLGSQKKSQFEKIFLRTKNFSLSIHKPLSSIENQWKYYSFGYHGCFSCFFHPEIIVRILRRKIEDISFLHLIRKVLHSNLYVSSNAIKDCSTKKIISILWNIYFLEIDNFFVSNCKNYCTSDEKNYVNNNYSLSCFQKMKEWKKFFPKKEYNNLFEMKVLPDAVFQIINMRNSEEYILDKIKQTSFRDQSITYKYFRANTSWFIFFQKTKPWKFLIKRRIILFFLRRLGFVLQENTMTLIGIFPECSKDMPYFFLAYVLQFLKKRNFVKINTKLFFLINYFVRRVVSFLNPFYLIILILSKRNFCNSFGYPKSKSGWVTLVDNDIIQHFNRIETSLFFFYSGCNNRKTLSRIQYILHFSCAKTLACKHKTNLRQIFKKFGNKFNRKDFSNNNRLFVDEFFYLTCSSRFFVSNQSKNFRLRFLWNNQKKVRVWNFHLTQMDSLIFQLNNFSKLVNM
jgi:hypothetical protein